VQKVADALRHLPVDDPNMGKGVWSGQKQFGIAQELMFRSASASSRTARKSASPASSRSCKRISTDKTARVQEFLEAGIIGVGLGAQYALLALGFTLIFGILGVVNFAHGGFYMLGGYVAYSCVSMLGLPYPLAVLVAVLATAALGWVFELLMIERLVDDHLATLMLTLALYLIISTGVLAIFGPISMDFTFPVTGAFRAGPIYVPRENLIVLAVCLAAIAGLYLVLFRTGPRPRAACPCRRPRGRHGTRPATAPAVSRRFRIGDRACRTDRRTGHADPRIGAWRGRPGLGNVLPHRDPGRPRQPGGAALAAFIVGIVEAYTSFISGLRRCAGAVRAGAAVAGVPSDRLART